MENLPNEILYQVFEHRDYWDLKLTIPAVCKHWQCLQAQKTQNGALDIKLFRDMPKNHVIEAGNFKMHPALKKLKLSMSGDGFYITIPMNKNGQPVPLSKVSLENENIVAPAVSAIQIFLKYRIYGRSMGFYGREYATGQQNNAISLFSLFSIVAAMFDEELPERYRQAYPEHLRRAAVRSNLLSTRSAFHLRDTEGVPEKLTLRYFMPFYEFIGYEKVDVKNGKIRVFFDGINYLE